MHPYLEQVPGLKAELFKGADLGVRDHRRAAEHFAEAQRLLKGRAAPSDLCDVALSLAPARAWLLDARGAAAAAREAIDLAERAQSPARLAHATAVLGALQASLGSIRDGLDSIERARALATEHGLVWQAEFARVMWNWVHLTWKPGVVLAADQPTAVQTHLSRIMEPAYVVGACARTGDLERGEQTYRALAASLVEMGQPPFGHDPDLLGRFLARRGEWQRAAALLDQALDWARRSQDLSRMALVQCAAGELALFQDEPARAETALAEAVALARSGEVVLILIDALALLAEACCAMGRLDDAESAVQEAQSAIRNPQSEIPPDWGRLPAPVALAEGLLRASQGAWEPAQTAFAEALAVNGAHGLRWDEAHTQYVWGEAILREGPASEYRRARARLREAQALWSEMGAHVFATRCAVPLA